MNKNAKKPAILAIAGILAFLFLALGTAEANVELLYFRSESGTISITLQWETASELDNLGFNILRSDTDELVDAVKINPSLIPSLVGGQPIGAYYEWVDSDVESQATYFYWLQDVDFNGFTEEHGPIEAKTIVGNTIPTQPPLSTVQSSPTSTSSPTPTSTSTVGPTPLSSPTASATPRGVAATTSSPTANSPVQSPAPSQPTQAPGANTQIQSTEVGTAPTTGQLDFQPSETAVNNREETPGPDVAETGQQVVESTTLVAAQPDSLESSAESSASQELADNNTTSIGSGRATDLDDDTVGSNETQGASGNSTLAILILAAALLLAVGGGVAVWLIVKPGAPRSKHE